MSQALLLTPEVPAAGRKLRMVIPIIPVGQMRARHGTVNGFSRTYKHENQVKREEVLSALLAQHQPTEPFDGQIRLGVRAYMPIPESKSKRWKASALSGAIRPTTKPDLDNLLKHVKDCLSNMRFWADDKLVVEYLPGTGKFYSLNPRWEIEIEEIK